MANNNDVPFFATAGPTSDLSRHRDRLDDLPTDPWTVGEIVRGLLLHDVDAARRGIEPSSDRDGMQIFGAGPILDRIVHLDGAPLDRPRPEPERLIGYCYHFALLHCSLLRAQGTPARTRCGFADYLIEGRWTDHWVVELWDGDHWRLHDPQLGLDDLTDDHFRTAVCAWELCRAGEADPYQHGIGNLFGWDELRGSLINDLGALNKVEIGDWGWCQALRVKPLDQPHPELDEPLDGLARLVSAERSLQQLWAAFDHDPIIRPPATVIDAASP